MNVTAQKFQSQKEPVSKPLVQSNHRTTLPQSRPLGVPAPSEREPGTAVPCNQPPKNRSISGDFHRPYETLKLLNTLTHRGAIIKSAFVS